MANINTSKSVGKPKPKPAPKPAPKPVAKKPVYKPAPPKKAPVSKSKAVYKEQHKPAPKPVAKPKPKPVAKPAPVKKAPASKMKDVYKDQHKPVAKPAPKVVAKPTPPKKAPASKMKEIYKDQHKAPTPPPKAPAGKMKDIYADQHKPVKPPAKAPVGKMKDIYKDLHKPVAAVKPPPPKVAPKGKMEDIYKDLHKPVTKAPAKPVIKAPTTGGTAPKTGTGTTTKLPTVALPKPVTPKPTTPTAPKPTTPTTPKPTTPTTPTAPKPTAPVAPPKPVTDKWGTVGPTNNGKANWNSNQSIPNYGSMTPEMIRNIEAGYKNGGKQYDPATDPVYQSMLTLANKQASAAGLASMEEMNERGILNSTVTTDRNQQIQQGASDAVLAQVPGLAANYQNQQSNSQAGYLSLLQTVMGGAENQQEFAEGNRRFDKSYQLDEAGITGRYNTAEAIANGTAKIGTNIQTLEAQGQYADQTLANQKLAFEKTAFNREMNHKEQESLINADLESRGLDLEAVKIGTDRFMAESDADYKQRQIDSNVTEVQAKTNTNKAIGNILGVDSLSEGFAFIESQTNSWASSGVDIRSVIDALESKFPGSKEALASSGGGGTSSYFGP